MNATLIALAVLPVVVLLLYIYIKDRYEREPLSMLLKAFFFGCLSVIPAIILEGLLSIFTPPFPISAGIYTGFVVAGASEELVKLLMLYWAVWRNRNFNEYFDGIVYATFVSLGFACVENIAYVFQAGDYFDALQTGTVRALLSVPGHFLFGVVMGYYFALAKFQPQQKVANLLKAFFVPMLLHGTYDSLLMVPEELGVNEGLFSGIFMVVFIWFDVKLWKIGTRKLRELQAYSQQQNDEGASQESSFQRNSSLDHIDWDV